MKLPRQKSVMAFVGVSVITTRTVLALLALSLVACSEKQKETTDVPIEIRFLDPRLSGSSLDHAISDYMQRKVTVSESSEWILGEFVWMLFYDQKDLAVGTYELGGPRKIQVPAGERTVCEWLALAGSQYPMIIEVSGSGVLQIRTTGALPAPPTIKGEDLGEADDDPFNE